MKKKYYAITTEMVFKKTILVPIEEVENIEQAEEIVDAAVEDCTIMLFDEDESVIHIQVNMQTRMECMN